MGRGGRRHASFFPRFQLFIFFPTHCYSPVCLIEISNAFKRKRNLINFIAVHIPFLPKLNKWQFLFNSLLGGKQASQKHKQSHQENDNNLKFKIYL